MGTYTFKHDDEDGLVELTFDDSEYITHMEVTRRFVDFLNGCGFQVDRAECPDLNEQARQEAKAIKKRNKT